MIQIMIMHDNIVKVFIILSNYYITLYPAKFERYKG